MWGAASRSRANACTLAIAFVAVLVLNAASAPSARAEAGAVTSRAVPGGGFALELAAPTAGAMTPQQLRALKRAGLSAVVIRPGAGRQATKIAVLARRLQIEVYVPTVNTTDRGNIARLLERCRQMKMRDPSGRCVAIASDPATTYALADSHLVDIILWRRSRTVRRTSEGTNERLLLFGPDFQSSLNRGRTTSTIPSRTSTEVALRAAHVRASRKWLLAQDREAPRQPQRVTAAWKSGRLSVVWKAVVSDGARSYGIYVDGTFVASSRDAAILLSGIKCGAAHVLAVDSVDSAANRSQKTWHKVTATPCKDVGSLAPNDPPTTSPDAPQGGGNTELPATSPISSGAPILTTGGEPLIAILTAGERRPLARLFLAPDGNDSCTRGPAPMTYAEAATRGNVCRTYQRAYEVAQDGDTVPVRDGTFTAPIFSRFIDSAATHSVSNPVTFVCENEAGDETVNHGSTDFVIRRAQGVSWRGPCFRFLNFRIGEGGDTGLRASYVTADGVRMSTFVLKGAQQATIKNSEIGPSIACWKPSLVAYPLSKRCQPSQPWPESWFYENDLTAAGGDGHGNAHISGNKDTAPVGLVFERNYQHDFQSRDVDGAGTDGFGFHSGCIISLASLPAAGRLDFTFRSNTWERCSVQGLYFETVGTTNEQGYSGVTIENNNFGWIVEPFQNTGNCCTRATDTARNLKIRIDEDNKPFEDWLIRFNTFKHGIDINGQNKVIAYSNARIIANILGKASVCRTGTGLSWNRNVWPSGSLGCGEANYTSVSWSGSSPLANFDEGAVMVWNQIDAVSDFHLDGVRFGFEGWITDLDADFALATDIDGQLRAAGARTPGADER